MPSVIPHYFEHIKYRCRIYSRGGERCTIENGKNWFFGALSSNESSGFDNAAIKADFEELYRLMNGKSLKEIDEIIYAVCTLCRDNEKVGFIEGVKIGMSLAKELGIL